MKVCGASWLTFISKKRSELIAVKFFKFPFWALWSPQSRFIWFHYINEKADISTVDISNTQQLTPKQSRSINSTTGKRKIWIWGCTVPLRADGSGGKADVHVRKLNHFFKNKFSSRFWCIHPFLCPEIRVQRSITEVVSVPPTKVSPSCLTMNTVMLRNRIIIYISHVFLNCCEAEVWKDVFWGDPMGFLSVKLQTGS